MGIILPYWGRVRQGGKACQQGVVTVHLLTNTTIYRILYRMKVTAIIADDLVNNVKAYTRSSTVTEAITIALKDWVDIFNIRELNKKIIQNPISIDSGNQIREVNRSI